MRRFLGLTLLPAPERRCQRPGVPKPRYPCGSPCSHCAGQRSSGWHQEGKKRGRTCEACASVPGGYPYRALHLLWSGNRADSIPLLPPLNHGRMRAICWYFSSLSSTCNLSVILASGCLFWGCSTPTMNIFSSEIPNRNAVCDKGDCFRITVNQAGPLIIGSIVFGLAYLETLPHAKSLFAFVLTFDSLQHKNVKSF